MTLKNTSLCFLLLMVLICMLCTTASAQEEHLETIPISSADDLYALGRILAPETAKSKYLANYNLEDDFLRFNFPETITSNKDKIEYLLQCRYTLTSDIAVSFCQAPNSVYFMGLGCSEYPFSGTFDGNGHTISLSALGDIGTTYYTGGYLGLFNVTKNAGIQNLTVCIKDSIILKSSYTNIYFGGFAGYATATALTNCSLNIEHADFGVIPTDANPKRAYVWIGCLIGYCKDSVLKNCSVELVNGRIVFDEQEDSLTTQSGIGGLIGRTVYEADYSIITGCSFTAANSCILNHTPHNGATGAVVGNATKTTVTDFLAGLKNSSIQTTAVHAQTGSMYSVLSTGGFIGFSQPGSNNTTSIGVTGNSIVGSQLLAETNSYILSSAQSGSEVTAGGLVGCSFNNLVIKDSSVYMENGSICAEKTGDIDTDSTYGTQVGGIIGRLEHTGELKNCSVTGDNMLIHSKCPNNQSNAGGIVGIDLGPYHKDVISLNGCSFDGSGNSEICMEVTSSDAVGSKPVSVGGIAGTSTYIVANCSVKDVAIALVAPELNNPKKDSALIGNYIKSWGWWAYKDFFTPRTPGINECFSTGIIWSGGCGVGVRWYVDRNVLRITGQGKMDDFSSATAPPWNKLKDQITTLELTDGLEYIGQYAFCNYSFLTVVIPNSVKIIGAYAFYNCSSLNNIVLGCALEKIEKAAFSCCPANHIAYAGTQNTYSSVIIEEDNPLDQITHWKLAAFPQIINTGVSPTCISVGLSEGTNCALCGTVMIPQTVIAPGDHTYDDCTCTVCGTTAEAFVSIYINGRRIKSYTSFADALSDYIPGQYIVLQKDIDESISIHADLYVDLNGHDLNGSITTNGHLIYGMDSSTDRYSMDAVGHFNCMDESGNDIIPVAHFKESITGSAKRYMTVKDENGFSFHRFYLGITHVSLKPNTTGVGYKAIFCGDDMVKAQLSEADAFGYTLQLGNYAPRSVYKPRSSFISEQSITLRVDNFDINHYGEIPLSASVMLKLSDGTVIESEAVSMTLRSILEILNDNYTAFTTQQLSTVKAMIEKYAIIKQWDTANLYA